MGEEVTFRRLGAAKEGSESEEEEMSESEKKAEQVNTAKKELLVTCMTSCITLETVFKKISGLSKSRSFGYYTEIPPDTPI